MKTLCTLAAFLLPLLCAAAEDKPKIDWQRGPCCGGNQPSIACKTCARCAYCGKTGKHGERPANSATCVVCERRQKQAPR
jgi:hypothetical protein